MPRIILNVGPLEITEVKTTAGNFVYRLRTRNSTNSIAHLSTLAEINETLSGFLKDKGAKTVPKGHCANCGSDRLIRKGRVVYADGRIRQRRLCKSCGRVWLD